MSLTTDSIDPWFHEDDARVSLQVTPRFGLGAMVAETYDVRMRLRSTEDGRILAERCSVHQRQRDLAPGQIDQGFRNLCERLEGELLPNGYTWLVQEDMVRRAWRHRLWLVSNETRIYEEFWVSFALCEHAIAGAVDYAHRERQEIRSQLKARMFGLVYGMPKESKIAEMTREYLGEWTEVAKPVFPTLQIPPRHAMTMGRYEKMQPFGYTVGEIRNAQREERPPGTVEVVVRGIIKAGQPVMLLGDGTVKVGDSISVDDRGYARVVGVVSHKVVFSGPEREVLADRLHRFGPENRIDEFCTADELHHTGEEWTAEVSARLAIRAEENRRKERAKWPVQGEDD